MKLNLKLYKDDNLLLEKEMDYEKNKEIITLNMDHINHQIDIKEKTLERYNEEFHFYLNFETEKCTYELRTHQAVFDIIVDYSFFLVTKNEIEMAYVLETDDQKCKILLEFQK